MSSTETVTTTQVHRVYIQATPERIWEAITSPEWTARYGYRSRTDYDLRPGGEYRAYATDAMLAYGAPEVVVVGEIVESDPPRRLVQTWHPVWDPSIAAEPATRLTWELEPTQDGVTRLTVTHDVEGAPTVSAMVAGDVPDAGGGWSFVLSELKTLLETGASFAG